jgi:D-inositol-3-phosphate glycosyltransferase
MSDRFVTMKKPLNSSKNQEGHLKVNSLRIAMISIHSSPTGDLGTKDTGGMSVYIRELARELALNGHRIDIYTRLLESNGQQVVKLHDNVRLIQLSMGNDGHIPKPALYFHLPDFFRKLENFRTRDGVRYDLIHSHYWLSGRLGRWAQDFWHVPHVIMFHTLGALKNVFGVGEQEPDLRIAVEKKLAKLCHRIVVGAQREKENLIHYYDVPHKKISVIPCGVNLNRFHPINKVKARRQLGFGKDDSLILYVGRFDPLKGLDRLLKAIPHLQHHHHLRVVIIGGDDHQRSASQKLRKMVNRLGIQDIVHFAGRIKQHALPPYYSAADVLVVPSYYESFGLVALESLACGTPVVTTPVGAMESIIREGETGCVLTDSSPSSLAKSIEMFITKENSKVPLSGTIRSSVLKFSWSNIASAIVEEYLAVLRDQQNTQELASFPSSLVSLN